MSKIQVETVDMAFLIDRGDKAREVVAVMPGFAGTVGRLNHCVCYVHDGQHGACDLDAIRNYYDEATPAEYADLRAELEGLGYNICVISRGLIDCKGFEAARRQELRR